MTVEPFDRSAPQFWVRVQGQSGNARVLVVPPEGSGEPLPENAARLLSFKYTDSEKKADKVELTMDNFDLHHFDDPTWKKGNTIVVRFGYPGRMAPERTFVITKIAGGLTLNVEAQGQEVLMGTEARCRLFENLTASAVARQIAEANGFGSQSQDIEDTEVVLPAIQQARMTDHQLLRRLANQEGFQFYIDYDGFHFHRRRVGQAPVRRFRYYTGQLGEILGFNVENDLTARPGRVRSRSRDPLEGEDVEGVSDTSGEGGETAGSLAIVRDQLTGILEILDPDSARDQQEGNVAQETVEPNSEPNRSAIQREANARQRRHQQVAVKLNLDVIGDPLLFAKTVVQIEGMGQRLSVRYWVKEVVHAFSGGYKASLKLISDGSGGHSTHSRFARGIELLDPGAQSRGRQNQQEAPDGAGGEQEDGDPGELTQVVERDEETGRLRIAYVDGRGRPVNTDEARTRAATARESEE